jgi:hypothetical protein
METVQQNLQRKIEGKANGSNGTNGDSRNMGRKMSQVHLTHIFFNISPLY